MVGHFDHDENRRIDLVQNAEKHVNALAGFVGIGFDTLLKIIEPFHNSAQTGEIWHGSLRNDADFRH